MNQNETFSFKFRFFRKGQLKGFRRQNGVIDQEKLLLKQFEIPLEAIVEATSRENVLVVALRPAREFEKGLQKYLSEDNMLALQIYRVQASKVEQEINRRFSKVALERRKKELEQSGKGQLFRSEVCPVCSAAIDLCELERTSYIYCPFCETVMSKNLEVVTSGRDYRICEECNMFDLIRKYTIFNFYFLFFIYGWSYRYQYLCGNCAKRISIKSLFINLLFVLGVPQAIYNLIRSQRNREIRFAKLTQANGLANRGKNQEADLLYNNVLSQIGEHPGILLNKGISQLAASNMPTASEYFRQSLRSTANYLPAKNILENLENAPKE